MQDSFTAFAQHLVGDIAVPELAKGYAALVQKLRKNTSLALLAREKGIDAVLASTSEEIAGLKKSNKELVTSAEKEAERLMTQAVKARYPEHAIVGEEHGYTPGSQIRWVFDPVDGTSAMIRTAMAEAFGLPLPEPRPAFGVTVAMVEGDVATLGVVTELQAAGGALAAVNTWVGAKGEATTLNGQPVMLPPVPASLAGAMMASTVPPVMFNTPDKWSGFQALSDATKGCVTDQNCVGFMRLLQPNSGIDAVYEADLAYHDAAALVPILQGAGVAVTDGKGAELRFPESAIGQEFSVLTAQPALHAQALERVLAGVAPDQNRFADAGAIHQGYAQKFPVAAAANSGPGMA